MKKNTHIALILFFTIFCTSSNGQIFSLDNSYDTDGKRDIAADCNSSILLSDDKLLVPFGSNSNDDFLRIAKYNVDGSLDTTFGINGIGSFESPNYYGTEIIHDNFEVRSAITQSDGKIVIGGTMRLYYDRSYVFDFFLFRFNANGTVDSTFGTNGLVRRSLNSRWGLRELFDDLAIDENGKIVAVGHTLVDSNEKADAVAMRFLSNGNIDTDFATNGILRLNIIDNDYFNQVKLLNSGSILIGGSYTISSTNTDMMVIKLNANGQYDNTFGTNGTSSIDFNLGADSVTKLFIKADDKIVVVGSTYGNIAFAKLDSNGNLDLSFSGDGKNIVSGNVPNHYSIGAGHVIQLQDNKYLIFSTAKRNDSSNLYDVSSLRINEDTTLDTTFANSGIFINISVKMHQYAYGLHAQTDGKVLLIVHSSTGSTDKGTVYRYITDTTLAVDEHYLLENLKIFPNPVGEKFAIESNKRIEKVEVYNLVGQKVKTINSVFDEIDFSDTEKGFYVLKIFYENNTADFRKITRK